MSDYPRSEAWFERARRSLAGGVSSQFRALTPPHPMFYTRAEGAHLWDVDGNRLLDMTLSQGPMIVGHSHPEVLEGIREALTLGQLFAGQYEQEVTLAETLQRLIPSAERVRFSSTGSEANHAALRLARYVTGRPKVIKFEGHYHGWFDNVSASVNPTAEAAGPRSAPVAVPWGGGIPASAIEDLVIVPWNDLAAVEDALRRHPDEIGAIITEPVMCNQGCIEPQPGFLHGLRALCDRHDIALIFDEIITGFRLDLGGAQHHYGVTPDLAVFGKALASGLPLSALVGRERFLRPVIDNAVFHAGTMNSNQACVAAAAATLAVLERDDAAAHRRLVELGRETRDRLAELGSKHGLPLRVQGPGPMFHAGFTTLDDVTEYRHTLAYDGALYGRFVRGMLARGVRLIGRGLWYVSTAHTADDMALALQAADAVLAEMAADA